MKKILRFPKVIIGLFLLATGIMLISSASSSSERETMSYHSEEQMIMFLNNGIRGGEGGNIQLPEATNSLFSSSGECGGCHGFDPTGVASTTGEGEDVNITDDWRAGLMANSAKDPFWRAKVSHEVAVNPQHQIDLENKCTTCHAPAGHYGALHSGEEHYSMQMLLDSDTLGLDGVNCVACHQQKPEGIGSRFSGELTFEEGIVYGPFSENIFGAPMISFAGYEPLYDEYITKSEACAGCHSLLTSTVDLEGEYTGDKYVEQATYHEWLNSIYSEEGNSTECQDCHMPNVNEPIVISNAQPFLPGREPFAQHELVGGNSFMLELMKNRREELNIFANEEQFDRTIAQTLDMLQNQSVVMEVEDAYIEDDSVLVEVDIVNITGHKFPSGYPARRAFIEVVVTDAFEDTIFSSGVLQDDYEVAGQNETYEPHYEIIRSEDQVQIYELVFGDVNGDVSTVLERAYINLKDNRLVPIGFSTSHSTYDTTMITGVAETDPNFNFDEFGEEGSGGDKVYYKIGLDDYEGEVDVSVKLFYQSTPPKWMEEMFSVDTPEINAFKEMYDEEGPDPVLIAEGTTGLFYVGVNSTDWTKKAKVFPNPAFSDGRTWLSVPENIRLDMVNVYDMSGRQVLQLERPRDQRINIQLPDQSGTYLIEAVDENGIRFIERVLR